MALPADGSARLIIHVGLHKTGSTWLQQEVFPNLEGIEYIGGVARGWLPRIPAGEVTEPPFEVPTTGTVLYSNESLAGPLWDPVPIERAVERVAAVFPGATVLLFTRHPESWRSSVYSQYVHEGGYLPPERFWRTVAVTTTGTDTPRVIAAFEERFPVVHVLAYEDIGPDPQAMAERVAALCGTTLRASAPGRIHNQSLSRPVRYVLRAWNRWFRRSRFNPSPPLPVPQAAKVRKVLQRYVDPHVPRRWR